MNPKPLKEYNFKDYKTDTVDKAVIKYGQGNVYTAVFNMEAKIASLQVEADSLREMIDWNDDEDEEMEFYHGKEHDMWMKGCVPLGQFINESGHKFDLGIWEDVRHGEPSFAIVYGSEGSQYISGELSVYARMGALKANSELNDYLNETVKRYNEYLNNKGERNGKNNTKEQG